MLNKLQQFVRQYGLLQPGEHVICAVSGGADSVALLFAMYLLKEKLNISLAAAHFNHHLRGEESDSDEAFVKDLCSRYDIPLRIGGGTVTPGKKGLEAAARDARYAFLKSLPGKIATAHTADDNAETVLMRMVRGTGLKGLGAIAPVSGRLIRPMLTVTRQEVLAFLQEYHLSYVEDSSNQTDLFLRNRLRHSVLPLLKQENPRLAENLSAMALRLQEDEKALAELTQPETDVTRLRQMPRALRSRCLAAFLEKSGVPELEAEHIALAEKLVFSEKPSAKAAFPGGVTVGRSYDRLEVLTELAAPAPVVLQCPGQAVFGNICVCCETAVGLEDENNSFTVQPCGQILLRSRTSGDTIRTGGGTKSLKKLFIDKKIPAAQRQSVPVVADSLGVLGVYGIGADQRRLATALPAVRIRFITNEEKEREGFQ